MGSFSNLIKDKKAPSSITSNGDGSDLVEVAINSEFSEGEVTLSFMTRGQKNPKGLPRIFFASHPEDKKIFLPKIWDLINNCQDAALFFEDGFLQWNELEPLLSYMQLIVMPVTTRLLTKENRAIKEILPFAEEKHIPILPLMFETGLDDVFNKIFRAER